MDRGAKVQPPAPDLPKPDVEDGLEVNDINRWKMAVREFIRSSVNAEGDVQAKTTIYEFLDQRAVSLRSLVLVALSVMKITDRFGRTGRMLQEALSGKRFPPIQLPDRIEIILLSDSSMSIGKRESNTVQFGDLIGDAARWDLGGGGAREASFYKRLRIDVTRITKHGATLPKLK